MDDSNNNLIDLIDVNVAEAQSLVDHPVMHHVNWTINKTDFWVVGGFEGAGKSDLLATAACLQKPLTGTQLLFGRDVRHMDQEELEAARLKIGMVFGNGRLFSRLTIAENIALPVCYHRDCPAEEVGREVNLALEICELTEVATKRPGEIARYLHQRIGLARALTLEPAALMIENPLFGLDQRQTRWWLDFLGKLTAGHDLLGRKMTLAVAADDFRPWADIGKQFGVIKDQQWHEIGSGAELKRSNEPLVRELLTGAYRDF